MKKLMLILTLLLGTLSFVACGKKDDKGGVSCQGYPAGYVAVTDQRMLQMINTSGTGYGGSYNNNYNNVNTGTNSVVCVDQYRYQQLQQQLNGNGNYGNVNCQQYPQSPECQGSGSGYNPNTDPYCDYYPYDPYCQGGGYYNW